jgi:hypothetical protein
MIYKIQAWEKNKLVLQREYFWEDQESDLILDCVKDFMETVDKYKNIGTEIEGEKVL